MTLETPHLLPHFRPHVGQKRFVGRVHGTGEHEVVPDGDAQLVSDLIGMKETSAVQSKSFRLREMSKFE
jgi:hypothetical protein